MICDDLRRNRLLGIKVSRYTETVLKNVLRVSKNPQVQSKPSYKLWFATKSFPGHQRVEVHGNSPRKRTQRVEKPPGTVKFVLQAMICDDIVSWVSRCRSTLKQSSKTCSACRKFPGTLKFARKLSSRHERVTAHRNSSQKCAQRVEKPLRYPGI